MTTTLNAARIELSRQLNDYWSGTTTGAGSSTTVVDTALIAKANDWITDNAYDFVVDMTGDTYNEQERKISSLDNTTGTLTVLAHGGALGSGATYEVHRLFTPSDKRRALVAACRRVFPVLHQPIRDESRVSGNWLKDGSFEKWTSTTALTYWTTSVSTLTQTSASGLFKHGKYSARLSGDDGYIKQDITNYEDLKRLAGKTVTFTAQGFGDADNCLRLCISDGTNDTYSDYCNTTTGYWTTNNEPMSVTATIQDHPAAVSFIVYHDTAGVTSYVDDARVICGAENPRIYIGDLGLYQNKPHTVKIEPSDYANSDDWLTVRDIDYDQESGYMTLPDGTPTDLRLRIEGIGVLDFLASGVSSTAWTATVAIDQPQLEILVAEAALYLYTQMSMPNFTSGDQKVFQSAMSFWKNEKSERINKFGMKPPKATISWGIS